MSLIKPSILTPLFKRKGGEGEFTKIVFDDNLSITHISNILEKDEISLILYYKNVSEWFLLSNKKIRSKYNGKTMDLNLESMKNVKLALFEEFKDGVRDISKSKRLKLTDNKNRSHLVFLESGLPYQGFYQVLHFLAYKNLI